MPENCPLRKFALWSGHLEKHRSALRGAAAPIQFHLGRAAPGRWVASSASTGTELEKKTAGNTSWSNLPNWWMSTMEINVMWVPLGGSDFFHEVSSRKGRGENEFATGKQKSTSNVLKLIAKHGQTMAKHGGRLFLWHQSLRDHALWIFRCQRPHLVRSEICFFPFTFQAHNRFLVLTLLKTFLSKRR